MQDASSPDAAVPDDEEVTEDGQPEGKSAPSGGVTRVQDPVLRSAIENHAVDVAIEHYGELGGSDFVKLGKPYDIRLTLDGAERHVEVKGSSMRIDTVELTINEVTHSEAFQPTDLAEIANQLGHANVNVTAGYLGRRAAPSRAASMP